MTIIIVTIQSSNIIMLFSYITKIFNLLFLQIISTINQKNTNPQLIKKP